MQAAAIRSMETNPAKLTQLYVEQLRLSAVKAGETIAIVSDLGTRREYIQAAFAAAETLGADIYEMCVNSLPGWTRVACPPSASARARSRRCPRPT
jgi:2,5-dihydroxypyridine 5,6-dioxygenase